MRMHVLCAGIALSVVLGFSIPGSTRHAEALPLAGTWQVLGAAATLPTLYQPAGLIVDRKGNIYVADAGNFRVVEIGPRGNLLAHFGEADLRPGPTATASSLGTGLIGPRSLAIDAGGMVYVADSINHYVRVFSPQHHLVGDWPISVPGANVLELAVAVGPRGAIIVAIAAQVQCRARAGPAYCATYTVIQRRSATGTLLSQFHTPIGPSGQTENPPVIQQLAAAVDASGNIEVITDGIIACYKDCDSYHSLVKYRSDGTVLAHWGTIELDVSADWTSVAIGGRGNIFVADDFNHRIDKRAPDGRVVARWSFGSAFPQVSAGPNGVAVDRQGNVYVSDPGTGRILKLSPAGAVRSQWGAGGAAVGRFWLPGSTALDAQNRLWVDDSTNGRVQVLTDQGQFRVQFAIPHVGPGMALDGQENVYLAQLLGGKVTIDKLSQSGHMLARWGGIHLADVPSGIAVASNGDIIIAGLFFFPPGAQALALDGEDLLRMTSSGRIISQVRISDSATGGTLAVDPQGNAYIAYGAAPHVEKRAPNGTVLASWGTEPPIGEAASPDGIALDTAGNVYIANTTRSIIQEFDGKGTPLSTWGFPGSYPGQFHQPDALSVDARGPIYVADAGNHRIQVLSR